MLCTTSVRKRYWSWAKEWAIFSRFLPPSLLPSLLSSLSFDECASKQVIAHRDIYVHIKAHRTATTKDLFIIIIFFVWPFSYHCTGYLSISINSLTCLLDWSKCKALLHTPAYCLPSVYCRRARRQPWWWAAINSEYIAIILNFVNHNK